MWRAIKLLHTVCAWSNVLAVAALQDLAIVLLRDHVIPYLRTQLNSASADWELVCRATHRAAQSLPAAWRRPDVPAGEAWSQPLVNFVANEVCAAFGKAHPAQPLDPSLGAAATSLADALTLLGAAPEAGRVRVTYALGD